MAEIINNLNGKFIATVYGYNTATRELDVFIPKLMPMIPEGQKERNIITNLGNPKINIKYNSKLKLKSTIKVRAKDAEQAIPNKGSKVLVQFYDDEYSLGFWEKFNTNNDYDVIEEEKYPRKFFLTVNNKKVPVNLDDEIVLNINGSNISLVEKEKLKMLNIISDSNLEEQNVLFSNLFNDQQRRLNEIEKNIQDQFTSITEIITENQTNIEIINQTVATLKENITELNNTIKASNDKIEEHGTSIEELRKTIETLQQEIQSLKENKEN